jgi:hypothetical protein
MVASKDRPIKSTAASRLRATSLSFVTSGQCSLSSQKYISMYFIICLLHSNRATASASHCDSCAFDNGFNAKSVELYNLGTVLQLQFLQNFGDFSSSSTLRHINHHLVCNAQCITSCFVACLFALMCTQLFLQSNIVIRFNKCIHTNKSYISKVF